MKIFLDDVRSPASYDEDFCDTVVVRSVKAAVQLLEAGWKGALNVESISLDYWLDDPASNGMDVLLWMDEKMDFGYKPPKIFIHSTHEEADNMRAFAEKLMGQVKNTCRTPLECFDGNHKKGCPEN